MRGISTVVDVTVFLLLVGGAVVTLVAAPSSIPVTDGNPAAENIRILATCTTTVNYSLAPSANPPTGFDANQRPVDDGFKRSSHGTLASLLADGAVGSTGIDGTQFSTASDDYERALASVVKDETSRPDVRTSVVAIWQPYPGSPLSGRVEIGDEPPRDADVHAATMRVESGIPAIPDRFGQAARRRGFQGVAHVLAEAVVRGLFPPRETRLALRGDSPVDALAVLRYRQTANALSVQDPLGDGSSPADANSRLVEALARRLSADLSERYESPTVAARYIGIDTVQITVRTWSP